MKKLWFLLAVLPVFGFFARAQESDVKEEFVSKQQSKKNVLMEEFTGTGCGYCPLGHASVNAVVDAYPGRVIPVNIHCTSLGEPDPGEPDLRTSEGTTLAREFLGDNGIPNATVNRHKLLDEANKETYIFSNYLQWSNDIPPLLEDNAEVNVAAKGKLDWNTRQLTLKVQLYYPSTPSVPTQYLHIALVQNNVISTQHNYGTSGLYNAEQYIDPFTKKYRHMHVFRDMLTDLPGEALSVESGKVIEKEFTYTLAEKYGDLPLQLQYANIVVFVTVNGKTEVANVCEAVLEAEGAPASAPDVLLANVEAENSMSCDFSAKVKFKLQNLKKLGSAAITEVVCDIVTAAGTTEFTHAFEPALAVGESAELVAGIIPLSLPNKEENITVRVKKINGADYDGKAEGKTVYTQHRVALPVDNVTMQVVQDMYGSEITWNLKDMDGKTVYEGGPYRDRQNVGAYVNKVEMTVPRGCLVLTFVDESGDGINNNYGEGYISMAPTAGGNEFYRHDGKYGYGVTIMVDNRPVSERPQELLANLRPEVMYNAVVSPNPAANNAVLRFALERNVTAAVRILGKAGNCALDLGTFNLRAGNNEVALPLEGLPAGMYFVNVAGNGVNFTAKLVVVR